MSGAFKVKGPTNEENLTAIDWNMIEKDAMLIIVSDFLILRTESSVSPKYKLPRKVNLITKRNLLYIQQWIGISNIRQVVDNDIQFYNYIQLYKLYIILVIRAD